jgi:hypothetical protein
MQRYLAPFQVMEEWLARQSRIDGSQFDLRYDDLIDIIRRLIAALPVDSTWYLSPYPGVSAAVERRTFKSAAHHYVQHGYFEKNLPFESEGPGRRYPPTFQSIKGKLRIFPVRGSFRLHISNDELFGIVREFLAAVPVDEAFYCDLYPGIGQAVAAGKISSAADHFVRHGYFEGRMAFPMPVDETWYLDIYRDVTDAVEQGSAQSAEDHFLKFGYRQGRLPRAL